MRQLRLVFAQTDKMTKVLVAATILPLSGSCGGRSDDGNTGQSAASGGASIIATGGNHGLGGAPQLTGGAPNSNGGSTNATGGMAVTGGTPNVAGGTTSTGGAHNATGGAMNTTGGAPNATGGSAATGGAMNATGGAPNATGGSAATGGAGACPAYASTQTFVVTLPSGATPTDAANDCNWTGTFANNVPAARVTLKYDSNSSSHTTGLVTIDPEVLRSASGGYLAVTTIVTDSGTVSNVTKVAGDHTYTFDLDLTSTPSLGSSVTVQVTLEFTCAPFMDSTRSIQTATTVTLCGSYDNGSWNWVSSGDTCFLCYPMVEMAAQLMPAPANEPDMIPLPGEIDIRITPVARQGRTLVLMLQTPRDAQELALTWQTSAGELLLAAHDVVVWTLPDDPGPHLVQVAAESGPTASIASFLYRDEA